MLEARLVGLEDGVRVAEPVREVLVLRSGAVEVLPRPLEVTVLLFRGVCALELGAA